MCEILLSAKPFMINYSILLDAVSPVVLAIPFLILLAIIATSTFVVLWLISYLKKRNKK